MTQETSADEKPKQILIGGPLIGNRKLDPKSENVVSWDHFEPIITPEIKLKDQQSQRFILLPHTRYISVLAYNTGSRIASLVPTVESESSGAEDNIQIGAVSLVRHPRQSNNKSIDDVLETMDVDGEGSEDDDDNTDEIVIMAGCEDGTIREFSFHCLENLTNAKSATSGRYHVRGPCCGPRRIIRVCNDPIMLLAAPVLRTHAYADGILLFAVTNQATNKGKDDSDPKKGLQMRAVTLRLIVPYFDGKADISLNDKDKKEKRRLDVMDYSLTQDKQGRYITTAPFRLIVVAKPANKGEDNVSSMDMSVFVLLARSTSITVHFEQLKLNHRFNSITFPMPVNNALTTINVANNNSDIACGHRQGDIRIMNGILEKVESYNIAMLQRKAHFGTKKEAPMKPEDPRDNFIATRVHWHAHPIASIAYDGQSSPMDPTLYSGGEESVLVTWQVTKGNDRPADVLPRLALGGVVHVACADRVDDNACNGILVFCEDNSLQLFESHNKGRMWKIQGLASLKQQSADDGASPQVEMDPRAKGGVDAQLIFTGSSAAPGYMHWYDPTKQRLAASLEVAPYNRISRTDREDSPMPTPSITNHAFSGDGDTLVTLDEAPTENLSIGASEKRGNEEEYGIVSTIRFWSWNESPPTNEKIATTPYLMAAAMTYPHGPKNRVQAMALSKDGSLACTVSNDEKAFRVWHKVDSYEDARRVPVWACRYKVSIPSGFSNFSVKRNAMSISDDGSIIAIGFGNLITLWDSEEARFLTSLRHLEDSDGAVENVDFVSPGQLQDLVLLASEKCISLQSPFGAQANFTGWSWGVPSNLKDMHISSAKVMNDSGCVAVSLFNRTSTESRIVIIDASTGGRADLEGKSDGLTEIEGCVVSLCSAESTEKFVNWGRSQEADVKPFSLYTLTESGNLILVTREENDIPVLKSGWNASSVPSGPKLNIERDSSKKRLRTEESEFALVNEGLMAKRKAIEVFGLTSGENSKAEITPTVHLPNLTSNFVRVFVGRSLSRRPNTE